METHLPQVIGLKQHLVSVANATADLLLLSAWSMALEYIEGEQIPVSIPAAALPAQRSPRSVLLLRTGRQGFQGFC